VTWRILHLDLQAGLPRLEAGRTAVYTVFWWGSLPLGARAFLPEELPLRRDQLLTLAAELVAEQLACRVDTLGGAARASFDGRPLIEPSLAAVREFEGVADGMNDLARPAEGAAADLSVIVCTRDRPEALASCLSALVSQRRPPGEILVVDNSAGRTAEPACRNFPQVGYVHEPRPGLSRARNAGIAASTRPLVAFTDDDVEVHSGWAAEIVRAFDSSEVNSVTGLVVPAALDTEAQRFFQFEMGGFGARYVPIRFDGRFFAETLRYGAQVWRVGAGANMAFRRSVFDRVGAFDERLGAGAAGCSEDSELWYRILAAGGTCLYEPRAVVFHHHRAEWVDLRRQMRAYMRGHVAALLVQNDRHGHSGNLRRIARQLPRYFRYTAFDVLKNGKSDRGRVLVEEIRGWMAGLVFAVRPRWRANHPPAPPGTANAR